MSTRMRYGLRFMLNLGEHYSNEPVFLKKISDEEEISEKYLSQIVLYLKKSGLINSIRGANGGYVLAKPPKDITLKNIYDAIEGEMAILDCLKNHDISCKRVSECVVRNVWQDINNSIDLKFASITLSDIMDMKKNRKMVMYNI
jgi:Rrf2 family protein